KRISPCARSHRFVRRYGHVAASAARGPWDRPEGCTVRRRERSRAPAGCRPREKTPMIVFAAALVAAAVAAVPSAGKQGAQALAQPGRDSALLDRGADSAVQAKEQEQERALRSLLALGGSEAEQAEVTARLANLLRARGLTLSIRAAAEAEEDPAGAERER